MTVTITDKIGPYWSEWKTTSIASCVETFRTIFWAAISYSTIHDYLCIPS